IWMNQQVVLSQKAREQHPMPVFIRASLFETVDFLCSVRLASVAELSSVCTQLLPESLFLDGHCRPRLRVVDRKCAKSLFSTSFRHSACVGHYVFQGSAKFL